MGFAVGCGPAVSASSGSAEGGDDASTSAASTSTSTTTGQDGTSSAADTTGENPSTTIQGQTETGDDPNTTVMSAGFIYGDPTGGVAIECSVWDQDCGEDEKCAPWANDGGDVHNATRCVPLDATPAAVGEPCVVEGSFVSGIDSCDIAALCTPLDEDSNEGVCTALCTGSVEAPSCEGNDEDAVCMVLVDLVLNVCGARCNPVTDTCTDGSACQAVGDTWGCLPTGNLEVGEPCFEANSCVEGAACVGMDALCPAGSDTCCSQVCDLSAPDPDAACTDGRTCIDFYPLGDAPPGYDNVGLCWAE